MRGSCVSERVSLRDVVECRSVRRPTHSKIRAAFRSLCQTHPHPHDDEVQKPLHHNASTGVIERRTNGPTAFGRRDVTTGACTELPPKTVGFSGTPPSSFIRSIRQRRRRRRCWRRHKTATVNARSNSRCAVTGARRRTFVQPVSIDRRRMQGMEPDVKFSAVFSRPIVFQVRFLERPFSGRTPPTDWRRATGTASLSSHDAMRPSCMNASVRAPAPAPTFKGRARRA